MAVHRLRLHALSAVTNRKLCRVTTREPRGSNSGLLRGSGGTYVEAIMRRLGLKGRSHCDRGFGGVSSRLVVFAKLASRKKKSLLVVRALLDPKKSGAWHD